MAKQDVRTFLAQLVDEIKMVELPENPEERNGTWSTVQEMTRNWTYTGKLSAKIKEKYEKHTRAMKVWQPLHDRMHASQRHLRKLNEDIISGIFHKTSGRNTIMLTNKRAGVCKCYVQIVSHNPT